MTDFNRWRFGFTVSCFSHLLGLLVLMSSVATVPTHCVLRTFSTLTWTTSLWGFTGCRVGFVRISLYIHLLSLFPWRGKRELCLHSLLCSHFPALPSHLCGCHGDEQNEHDCTLRQICRKGRRDTPLSLPLWLSLCCVRGSRLQHRWPT